MSPRPALFEIGKLEVGPGRVGDFKHRQRGAAAGHADAVLFLDHDKTDPGPQPLVRPGAGGSEKPGKIRPVEFDTGKQIVRIVSGEWTGLGADDLPGIDARDIGGSVELNSRCRGELRKLEGNRDGYLGGLFAVKESVFAIPAALPCLTHGRK